MKTTDEIDSDDMVTSNGKYNLDRYFNQGALRVTKVKDVNLSYAGDAIVYCDWYGTEVGFYINGLRKI